MKKGPSEEDRGHSLRQGCGVGGGGDNTLGVVSWLLLSPVRSPFRLWPYPDSLASKPLHVLPAKTEIGISTSIMLRLN